MKKPTVSSLKKKCDTVFSQYVRRKGGKVYTRCYTCRVRKKWKELQCGHFISRGYNSVRYDEMNTRPQCVGCNMFQHGKHPEFALKLLEEYGEAEFKKLLKRGKETHQFTIKELQGIKEYYEDKLKELDE